MIRSLEQLVGYHLSGTDGSLGTVVDFLFLDDSWGVPYAVVKRPGWFRRRRYLLETAAIRTISAATFEVRAALSRDELERCRSISDDPPVEVQKVVLQAGKSRCGDNWEPPPFRGINLVQHREAVSGVLPNCNPHLQSLREVTTYQVRNSLTQGYVNDLVADDQVWRVTGLVIGANLLDTSRGIVVPASRIGSIDWQHRLVEVRASYDAPPLERFPPGATVWGESRP